MIAFAGYVVYRSETIFNNPCQYIESASGGKMMCVMNITEYQCYCNKYTHKKDFSDLIEDIKDFGGQADAYRLQ